MRLGLILVPTMLVATPSAVFGQDKGDGAASAKPESEKKICRNESRTGSLLRRERICMAAAEWNRQADTTRADMERFDRVQSRALRTDPRTGQVVPD